MKFLICQLIILCTLMACSLQETAVPDLPILSATAVHLSTATETSRLPTETIPPHSTETPSPDDATSTSNSTPIEEVTFLTEDGVRLAGTLFGDGDIAVILAHQGTVGADQTTWHPFAHLIAERGFTAFTLDFRSKGQSEGQLEYGSLGLDINATIHFLQTRGYSHIICVGASMGGTACIRAALENDLKGLIVFASTMIAGAGKNSLKVEQDDLADLTLPKLFITADKNSYSVVDHIQRMYDMSPEPKDVILLEGSEHGTDLFDTEVGDELTITLLEFLENFAQSSTGTIP